MSCEAEFPDEVHCEPAAPGDERSTRAFLELFNNLTNGESFRAGGRAAATPCLALHRDRYRRGFVWIAYTCMLLGYWGAVWLIRALPFGRGRSLGLIVAVSGWLPPVACGLWLLWLIGLFRG